MRDDNLHQSRLHAVSKGAAGSRDVPEDELCLFEVLDSQQVFSQTVFSRVILT